MKKRLFAFFMAVALMISWFLPARSISAATAATARWTGPEVAVAGEEVTVTLWLNGTDVRGVQGTLSYDASQLTYVSSAMSTELSTEPLHWYFRFVESTKKLILEDLELQEDSAIEADTKMVTFTFTLKDDLAPNTLVTISLINGKTADSEYVSTPIDTASITIRIADYVAAIGETKYESLAAAVAAAQAGDTVKLLKNITLTDAGLTYNNDAAQFITKDITLDGDGHKITADFDTYNCHVISVEEGATVTIKNLEIDGNNDAKCAINAYGGSKVTLDNVKTENVQKTSVIANGSEVIIKGNSDIAAGEWHAVNADRDGAKLTIEAGTINGLVKIEGGSATITGGTINGAIEVSEGASLLIPGTSTAKFLNDESEYCADGYKTVQGSDNYWTVAECHYVAQIGETKYESLAEAVAAAVNGDTIVMIADETIGTNAGVTVPAGKSITLDLNGHTVSQVAPDAAESYLIRNNGTLTIKDSGTNGKLTANAATPDSNFGYGNYTIFNNGTLTVKSGIIDQTTTGQGAYYAINSASGATLNIEGGVIKSTSITVRIATFDSREATLNITGGKIESGYYAVQFYGLAGSGNYAHLNISGGEFTTTDTDYSLDVYVGKYNGSFDNVFVSITGGIFEDNVAFTGSLPADNIEVSGGVFKGSYGAYSYDTTAKFITGGIFKTLGYWQRFVEDGMTPTVVQSGTYAGWYTVGGVKVRYDCVYEGETYTSYFATLEDAFDSIYTDTTDNVLTILDDITINANAGAKLPEGLEVTLDLNGKTVSQVAPEAKDSYLIENHGTLTIKDSVGGGKLTAKATTPDAAYGYGNYTIENFGTLTVQSGTIEQTSTGAGAYYAIDTREGATLNINGGHITSDSITIRVATFNNNEATLNITDGTIDGGLYPVQYYGLAADNHATLNVTGGTITTTDDYYNLAFYVGRYSGSFDNVTVNISGGTFDGDVGFTATLSGENISVTGGVFDGDVYSYSDDPMTFITGGIFRSNDPETMWWMKYIPADSKDVEITEGDYIGWYTLAERDYVAQIGTTKYESLADAVAAAVAGDTIEIIKAGTYRLPNIPLNVTIKGAVDDVIIDATGTGSIAAVPNGMTLENLTVNFGQNNYHGFQHAGTIEMKDCELNGLFFSYGDMNFTDCVFNQDHAEYVMWAYGGDLNFTNCEFNVMGKALNVYNESGSTLYNITFTGCEFNSDRVNKSAINVKETCGSNKLQYKVTINNCTTNDNFPTNKVGGSKLYMVDDQLPAGQASGLEVWLDGVLVYPVYVAAIGEARYSTLQAAIEAAQAGDTIVLLKDITVVDADIVGNPNNRFVFDLQKNVTIDGDGHSILADFSTNSIGKAGGAHIFRVSGATATFEDLTVKPTDTNLGTVKSALNVINGSNITLNNCEFTTSDLDNSDANWNIAAVIVNGSTVTVNGGTYRGGKANDYQGFNVDGTNTQLTINSGDTNGIKAESATATVIIKDGVHTNYGVTAVEGAVVEISGGYFGEAVPEGYCAEGYIPTGALTEGEHIGMYTVKLGEYVAAIGETKYETLAAAVAAAQAGDTVTLLKDITLTDAGLTYNNDAAQFITKDITLDGDGHKITADFDTYNCHVISVEEGATVTIKNLEIDGNNDAKCAINAYGGSKVTLDNVKTENVQKTSVIANGSEVIIKGNSDIAAGEWHAVNADRDGAKLTIEDGTINGLVKIEDGSATITGGTINGAIEVSEGASLLIPGTSTAKFLNDETEYCESGFRTAKAEGEEWYTVALGEFTVTFKLDGEVFSTVKVIVGEAITTPTAPDKDGYTFGGWQNVPTVMPAEDIEITGLYTPITYTITYVDGTAEGNPTSYTVEDEDITLIAPTKTEGGYTFTFDGWYDGDTKVTVIDTASMKDYTLTAKWLPDYLTSDVFEVDQDLKYIQKVEERQTSAQALAKINERDYTELHLLDETDYVGTGATADLMHGTTVYKTYTFIVTGDVNGDGVIDISDLVRVRNHILGLIELTDVYAIAADVNGDGDIDIADITAIRAHILGIQSVVPK